MRNNCEPVAKKSMRNILSISTHYAPIRNTHMNPFTEGESSCWQASDCIHNQKVPHLQMLSSGESHNLPTEHKCNFKCLFTHSSVKGFFNLISCFPSWLAWCCFYPSINQQTKIQQSKCKNVEGGWSTDSSEGQYQCLEAGSWCSWWLIPSPHYWKLMSSDWFL